jgi:methylglutaconyl-CoA hydratase
MTEYATLTLDQDPRGVATLTLDRPDVRNAIDATLIHELGDAVGTLATDDAVRVVVITGAGPVFSAGADLNWMSAARGWTREENVDDARGLGNVLRALYDLPKPLIGRVNGHALGGGLGFVATCDVAIAVEGARMGFTEVALGIAPAVISPFVLRKVSRSFARAAFVTGERFGAARALAAGLVHEVVAESDLDDAVATVVDRCLRNGPQAMAAAKRLPDIALQPLEQACAETAELIATLRTSEEGREGMRAFLEHRDPSWAPARAARDQQE